MKALDADREMQEDLKKRLARVEKERDDLANELKKEKESRKIFEEKTLARIERLELELKNAKN